MLTCLIIDDEQGAINILKTFIEKTPFLQFAESTTDPVTALEIIKQKNFDLIFLDIQMPHLSGFDLLKMIKVDSKVIITTAYSEFALEGYELGVLDYLLKPISFERFLKAAQKALNKEAFKNSKWQPAEQEEDFIFVKTENKGKMIRVNFSDITYVEGLKNYLSIHTKEESVITLLNIKDLEAKLPERRFMRVHKSYIINMDRIKAVDGNQILLKEMKAYIPLGETYRNAFFTALQEKIMGGKK